MNSTTFNTAAEVRAFLKNRGFDPKTFGVRFQSAPFSGCRDLFFVKVKNVPAGVAVATSGGSQQPTTFFSSDSGKTAKVYADFQVALDGTNAKVE